MVPRWHGTLRVGSQRHQAEAEDHPTSVGIWALSIYILRQSPNWGGIIFLPTRTHPNVNEMLVYCLKNHGRLYHDLKIIQRWILLTGHFDHKVDFIMKYIKHLIFNIYPQ